MILDSLKNIVLQKNFRLLRGVPQARRANLPTCWHCVSIVTGAVGACNSWPFFATNIYDLFISNNHLRRGDFLSSNFPNIKLLGGMGNPSSSSRP